ncbi:hypothetical protein F2Q69_00024863 [Brassica cretica]|uniref:Major facilitator superfamily (MFS) profile domain-containing protein n=1 Tax=Brassica cretica TaxID=69181 RepID=A0A8S9Q783_BRACR|nr:hypothetical protein F2Q69_00024863 [Brassica cretica]
MWVSDILCVIGWLCIAFAKNVLWLHFGRISSGIGIGLISYVVPVYIAEITPKHVRGTFTSSNQLLQNSGLAMVFFGGNFISWRKMALLGKTNYYFIINMEVMFKYGRKWHIEV